MAISRKNPTRRITFDPPRIKGNVPENKTLITDLTGDPSAALPEQPQTSGELMPTIIAIAVYLMVTVLIAGCLACVIAVIPKF
jgi:hypothetical protein